MKFLLLVTLLLAASCASVHPGKIGQELDNKKKDELIVSVEKVETFSDPTISFLSITMENNSEKWLKFKNSSFNCGKDCNEKINIIVGDDLVSWAKSKKDQMDIKQQNEKILLGGLTAGGLLFTLLSSNNDFAIGGAILATAGATATMIKDLNVKKTDLESANWVPKEHFYSDISVPTSLFTRKWILINHPKNFDINSFILKFKTIEDDELKYIFKI